MKHDAKSKGCRLDLSIAEIETILALATRGQQDAPCTYDGVQLHRHLIQSCLAGLRQALAAQISKASEARSAAAIRRARAAGPDKRWKRVLIVQGHNVTAERDDFVDVGPLEYRAWQSLPFLEAMKRVPEQAEIRRDVWLVRVCTTDEQRATTDRLFVGSDVTETNNPAEIEGIAERLIQVAA